MKMSDTIIEAASLIRGDRVGELDMDNVALESVGGAAVTAKFTDMQQFFSKEVRRLRSLENETRSPDPNKVAAEFASKAKKLARLDAVCRTQRTFSAENRKGENYTVGGKVYRPLINRINTMVGVAGMSPPKDVAIWFSKHWADEELREWIRPAMFYVCASGPLKGFFHRVIEGANRSRTFNWDAIHKKTRKAILEELVERLPFFPGIVVMGEMDFDSVAGYVEINQVSEAGYPYDVKKNHEVELPMKDGKKQKVTVLNIIKGDARKYWNACGTDDGLRAFYLPEPARNYFKLKNKLEKVKVGDVERKIRPYFVSPGAQQFVWSGFHQLWEHFMANFSDQYKAVSELNQGKQDSVELWWQGEWKQKIKNSSNAVGFTFTNKGTEKLVYHLFNCPDRQIRYLHYADDGLWSYRVGGRVWLCWPDIAQEDASLSIQWVPLILDFFIRAYKAWTGESLPNIWGNVHRDLVRMGFNGPFIAFKQLVYNCDGWFRSGIPGTSHYDTIAAVVMDIFVDRYRKDHPIPDLTLEDDESATVLLNSWFAKCCDHLKTVMGLEIKPATQKWSIWIDTNYLELHGEDLFIASIPVPPFEFLGMHLVRHKSGLLYPSLSKDKMLATLWAPKPTKPPKGVEDAELFQLRLMAERTRMLAMVGGWLYPKVYKFLKSLFVHLLETYAITSADEFIGEEFLLVPGLQQYLRELRDGEFPIFPPRRFCKAIYDGTPREGLTARVITQAKHWGDEATAIEVGAQKVMELKPNEVPPQIKNKAISAIVIPKGLDDIDVEDI